MNVRAGGTRATAGTLLERALEHRPDALVFSEFRDNAAGELFRRGAAGAGLTHECATLGHRGNGVLIAAARPFTGMRNPFGLPEDDYPNAVIEARFEDLRLFGVYLPGQDRKRPHLRCFIATARRYDESGIEALAIGDFNSGRNATDIELNVGRSTLADEFSTADLYAELECEWTEAWQHLHPDRLEYSWYPFRKSPPAHRRNGWRIDKAFVSRALQPRLLRAAYDHGFRLEGLTDHSALIVDLAESNAA